jgi:hypothetical protein
MDPASLIQTMPAEMVSDYLTCRQEQKILVHSLRSERKSGKAPVSLFASRLIDARKACQEALSWARHSLSLILQTGN